MGCVPFFTQNSNFFLFCKNKTRTHKHHVLRRELQTVSVYMFVVVLGV